MQWIEWLLATFKVFSPLMQITEERRIKLEVNQAPSSVSMKNHAIKNV